MDKQIRHLGCGTRLLSARLGGPAVTDMKFILESLGYGSPIYHLFLLRAADYGCPCRVRTFVKFKDDLEYKIELTVKLTDYIREKICI